MIQRHEQNKSNIQNSKSESVVYARVSSKEQEKEGFSIPSQLKLLDAYAQENNFVVARQFVDVETAKQTGRSSFGDMVAFLKSYPDCRAVLVEKTDRLYRNLKDWVTVDDLDLEIHFVKENVILSRDSRSSEKFVHGIKVLMAKNYIDNLSEETRKGMTEKAEQGIWPTIAPLGYRNADGPNCKRVIEPDPHVAPHIKRLYERYSTSEYSLKEVTKMAKADGMVFPKSGSQIPKGTVHRILRKRIYMGDFDWKGRTYHGTHTPLVSCELWEKVQQVLDFHFNKRHRKAKHDFAFSRLITCGHCGCSLVGEIKKGRYVYYHCTGYKGKCPEPYTREEVLEAQFVDILKGLAFDNEVLDWVTEALRQSHADEKHYHDEAISQLQGEYNRLQNRIDAMYVDKLDGKINIDFYDRKATEWRYEQDRLLRSIEDHQNGNKNYLDEGVMILELARQASYLFERQGPREKRNLLNFVLSNCTWKDGQLVANYRQPFDGIAKSMASHKEKEAVGASSNSLFDIWRPCRDSNSEPTA